jgi:alkylated DNA repair dioxygenase AlkB
MFMPQGSPVLFDVERQSYVFHWKKALPQDACDFAFDKLLKEVPWDELKSKRGFVTRKSCWISGLGQSKCTCGYVYGETSLKPAYVNFVDRLTEVVFGSLFPDLPKDWHPTCVNCNLYEGGEHSCGWHADDEKLFGDGEQDVTIVSLSLGAAREFWLTLRKRLGEVSPDEFSLLEMDLEHGDLLTMEGKCQKHTIHMLPRAPCTEPRINLTWRWIRKHSEECALVHQNRGTVQRGVSEFVRPRPALPIWCHGYEVFWGLCDFCQHPGYKNGRLLVPTEVGNVCRLCLPEAQLMAQQNTGWTTTPWGMVPPDMSGAMGVPPLVPPLQAYGMQWPVGPAAYPDAGAMPPVMQGW